MNVVFDSKNSLSGINCPHMPISHPISGGGLISLNAKSEPSAFLQSELLAIILDI